MRHKRRAEAYENEWLDSVFHNADSRQVSAAKARAQEAKGSVKSWNEKLSEAYGLGENGYWNRSTSQPKTQQSAQMRANPAHAYAAGNGRPAQTTRMTPAQPRDAAVGTDEDKPGACIRNRAVRPSLYIGNE